MTVTACISAWTHSSISSCATHCSHSKESHEKDTKEPLHLYLMANNSYWLHGVTQASAVALLTTAIVREGQESYQRATSLTTKDQQCLLAAGGWKSTVYDSIQ